ncbi:MAG TPA: PadR family transcriptional regulator [Nocardioidaceae bacterium]|nr:PadR family transcriptional regulator [Nocardioidaceae bacterium]
MSRAVRLTTTSYAILSLLAVRSWSAYELTRQMDRSLGRIWPRAESKLYEEPKKLAAGGYARAKEERLGDRPRTVYSITPKGRRALAAWQKESSAGFVLESEHLLKIFFAENGTREDALATLSGARAWAEERNEGNLEAARSYLAGEGPFQERAAQTLLVGRFISDFYKLVADWADWASDLVEQWPDDPAQAVADVQAQREIVDRAGWSE